VPHGPITVRNACTGKDRIIIFEWYCGSGSVVLSGWIRFSRSVSDRQLKNQFIEKHKQHNSKLLKCDIMTTMCFKGQKGPDGTNNCYQLFMIQEIVDRKRLKADVQW